jgi:hypothetical protein
VVAYTERLRPKVRDLAEIVVGHPLRWRAHAPARPRGRSLRPVPCDGDA